MDPKPEIQDLFFFPLVPISRGRVIQNERGREAVEEDEQGGEGRDGQVGVNFVIAIILFTVIFFVIVFAISVIRST